MCPATGSQVERAAPAHGWVVEESLHRLAPEHRAVLVETYLEERAYAEVAGELGLPVGTVRSTVSSALEALRLAVDEMGVEP